MATQKETSEDLRKKQILEASIGIFGRFGFAKTTLDDIAEAVGMKKASLYYYYDSKEDIFRDAIKSETDGLISELEDKVFKGNSVEDQLKIFIKTRIKYFQKMMNLHNIAVNVILEVRPLIDQLYKEFIQKQHHIIETVITHGIKSNTIKKCDTSRVASTFLSAVESFAIIAMHKSKNSKEINYKKIEDDSLFLAELLINGLRK